MAVEKVCLMPTFFWPLFDHKRMSSFLEHFCTKKENPHSLYWAIHLVWEYLSLFQAQWMLLCLYLKHVHHITLGKHLCYICHPWRGNRVFSLWHENHVHRQNTLCQSLRGTHWPSDTNAHYLNWFYSVSSLGECSVVPLSTWLCCVLLGNSNTKKWAEVFGLLFLVIGIRMIVTVLHTVGILPWDWQHVHHALLPHNW